MKTRDLIAALQAQDPSGNLECYVGGDDIYFVTRQPFYYDGRPARIVHDEALRGKAYSIVGAEIPQSGEKVRIVTLDLEAMIFENPDLPVECSERERERVDSIRKEVREAHARIDGALLQTEARAETGEGKSGVCGEKMGKKPEWMSEWQYDPCSCKRRAGHDGPHACEHENAEMLRDHEKGGGT
jgi:hypothetical protein